MDTDLARPRVLIVSHVLVHYRRAIMQELLDSERLDVTLAAAPVNDLFPDVPTLTVGDLSRPTAPLINVTVGPFLWQRGLLSLLARQRPDKVVLLGDWSHLSTWCAAVFCHALRTPAFFWTHGWNRPEPPVRRHVRLLFYRLAAGMLLYGDRGQGLGIAAGYGRDRLTVIYNSLDVAALTAARSAAAAVPTEELRRRHRLDPTLPVVVVCGRLSARKRLDLLIEASALLRSSGRPVQVVLIGDGPDRARLIALAAAAGISARFFGSLYDERTLAEIYRVAAVAVLPAAAGLPVVQSLHLGRPAVVSDDPTANAPEWEAVVPGRTGGRFAAGSAADLAQVLDEWVNQMSTDPATVELACRTLADDRYSAAAQRRRIEDALLGVVPNRGYGD